MNHIIENILLIPGSIFHYLYPYKLARKFTPIRRRLYTGWIKPNLSKIGPNSSIDVGFHLVGGKMISIGRNCCIDKHCSITALTPSKNSNIFYTNKEKKIILGDNITIGPYAHITAINEIIIESNVNIGPNVLITDNSKKATKESLRIQPRKRKVTSKGKILIGEYTWVGERVAIMPGVKIGKSCVIGAGSVVTKDIPDNSVAAGVPAKIISIIN